MCSARPGAPLPSPMLGPHPRTIAGEAPALAVCNHDQMRFTGRQDAIDVLEWDELEEIVAPLERVVDPPPILEGVDFGIAALCHRDQSPDATRIVDRDRI